MYISAQVELFGISITLWAIPRYCTSLLINQASVIQSLGLNKNVWAKIWLNDVRESQSSLHWVKQNIASSLQGAYPQRRSTEAYGKISSSAP